MKEISGERRHEAVSGLRRNGHRGVDRRRRHALHAEGLPDVRRNGERAEVNCPNGAQCGWDVCEKHGACYVKAVNDAGDQEPWPEDYDDEDE